MTTANSAASIRARLLSKARNEHQEFEAVLTRYGLERFLYRLGASQHRDQFLLKGALLFDLWFGLPARPTRDIDLLGFGSDDIDRMVEVMRGVCAIPSDDGVVFDPASVKASEIRKQAYYPGVRLKLQGRLDRALCSVQLDVGFGDAVTPGPVVAVFPVLLPNLAPPTLQVYPVYTVVAEKLDAIVTLGMANTRLKDYFDLWILAKSSTFEAQTLHDAVAATLERRRTSLPSAVPLGLTDIFVSDMTKQTQWSAFLGRNKLDAVSLGEAVELIRGWLLPMLSVPPPQWIANGEWRDAKWNR
jgi:predicted nucleotidyltransferase component of viral defense system